MVTTFESREHPADERLPVAGGPSSGRTRVTPSAAQEGIWFLSNMDGLGTTHNVSRTLRFRGTLDHPSLERSLQDVLDRHDALRTVFHDENGLCQAEVLESVSFPISQVDLGHLPPATAFHEAERQGQAVMRQCFDLSTGPLLKAVVFRLQADDHLLLLIFHHIVIDAAAFRVFVQELTAFYRAHTKGLPPALPPMSFQYADYARHQRDSLTPERRKLLVDYWRSTLEGIPALLELPRDRRRPLQPTFESGNVAFTLPPELLKTLSHLRATENVSLFVTFLAAFQVLLMRLSGQDDVVVGVSHVDRSLPQLDSLIGCFVNMLPLRTRLHGNPRFRDLLHQVHAGLKEALAHHELPFQDMVRELASSRHTAGPPLFQASILLHHEKIKGAELDGLEQEYGEIPSPGTSYDLTLFVTVRADGATGRIEYNRALFDDSTVHCFVSCWRQLLAEIARNPDETINQLPLLVDRERHRLLVDWNATDADYDPVPCVHELFEAQVERTPDAMAVVFEGAGLTYGQLNACANRLARHLRARGVGPDVPVALCLERSPAMVVGMFAILKAGGAYVPLDPDYPADRLAFMFNDLKAPLVLSHSRLIRTLPLPPGMVALPLDDWTEPPDPATPDACNPDRAAGPENLAYLIYTSGSTGQPKGVQIPHRALVNHVQWMQSVFPIGANDAVLQKTPFSFDASVWEFHAPLAAGSRLVLARPGGHQDLSYLIQTIQHENITILQLVPFLLNLLLKESGFAQCKSLRRVFCGGEALTADLARNFCNQLGAELHNLYGPTEVTIDSIFHSLDRNHLPDVVPLGRPVANVRAYILDGSMQPVPIGVAGELYLGGVQVARGYHNRPDLTARRFLPDPFRPGDGFPLYRTGDRARYRPDGVIEFLGRIDQMVKVRGCSIELEEIEAVLRRQTGIHQCAMLVHEVKPGDQRLVAYVVPSPGVEVDPRRLGELLRGKLPVFMLPSAYVTLDSLPLTPSGKLDRKALPFPGLKSQDRENTENRRTTLTATEAVLASIWSRLFGLETIEPNDDFFALGGHSLLAVQVMAKVRDHFNVDLPMRAIFEAPTLAAMAGKIELLTPNATRNINVCSVVHLNRQAHIPLSFAQLRLWFLDQYEPGNNTYNLPLAVRLDGRLDVSALELCLTQIVGRHETLRTVFADGTPEPSQIILPPTPHPLSVHDLSSLPKSGQDSAIRNLTRDVEDAPFDLKQGPLFRTRLLRLGENEHVLLLTLHHIISDGWSISVLMRELGILYTAAVTGGTDVLPPLALQYADYAAWQRQWLHDGIMETQLAYWRKQLANLPPPLDLPTDRPRPATQSYEGARQRIQIPADLTRDLRALSRREGTTLFITLLASFKVLLYRLSGQDDLCIGTPVAGRRQTELEGLIGFFVNTLVLRSRVRDDLPFRRFLAEVKECALEAFAHEDVPFEKLVEALNPLRDPGHTPLFQVMFALGNTPPVKADLPGLVMTEMESDYNPAKFDLTLLMEEQGNALAGSLVFSSALFEATTIRRMLDHWQQLLTDIVANPDECVDRLTLLTPDEKTRMLCDWNATSRPYPISRGVHHLFEDQAHRTPEAVAVRHGNQTLTYRDLNHHADQLAAMLRQSGIGAGTLVGLCCGRDPAMVIGMLGILKSGGAYVPLDPSYPKERLDYMLKDTRSPVVVTQSSLLDRLPEYQGTVVSLDTGTIPGSAPRLTASDVVGADSPAYVIYTSGSSGQPKGVVVPHRAISRLVINTDYISLDASDVVAEASRFSFDAATFEIWGALLNGARLDILPESTLLAPEELSRHLQENGVTTLFVTTALFNLIAAQSPTTFRTVKTVLFGGEAVTPHWVDVVLRGEPPARLLHVYGPTETTTFATWHHVDHVAPGATTLPIGQPIANTHTHILDSMMQPVPIGVAGELYIGGDGLALEYWNRPDLTALHFVRHPFNPDPTVRLYRTGDRARYRADGAIEFLGRLDLQVKVRGHRIELEEIEAVLSTHPSLRQCAVTLRQDDPDDKRLVAYGVPARGDAPPTSSELRRFLKNTLPDYMIPATFVMLDTLPLSPNGKINRNALPAPDPADTPVMPLREPPRTPTEEKLCRLWDEVLGTTRIGIHDNFFDCGGHSLLGVRLVARIREEFQSDLPLRILFQAPTIAELAPLLHAEALRDASVSTLVTILKGKSGPPLFFVPGGGGGEQELMVYARLMRQMAVECPVYGFSTRGLDGLTPPHRSVRDMTADYLEEIRRIQSTGPYYLVGECIGGILAYEMARQLRQAGEEVAMLALLDTNRPSWMSILTQGIKSIHTHLADATSWWSRLPLKRKLILIPAALRTTTTRLGEEFGVILPRPVPGSSPEARQHYISRVRVAYRNTLRRCRPRPYDGKVILMLSDSVPDRVATAWAALARGGHETHRITGDHASYIRDHAVTTGTVLGGCLARARQATSGGQAVIRLVGQSVNLAEIVCSTERKSDGNGLLHSTTTIA